MDNNEDGRYRATELIRKVARGWSAIVVGVAILVILSCIWNFITIGVCDPNARADYPWVENLIPLTLLLSVMALCLAWKWEGMGGGLALAFHIGTISIHHIFLSPRPYPWAMTVLIATPAVLFLASWWLSRDGGIPDRGSE